MGQSAAQTLREIEDIRGRLQDDFRELEDRLPQPAVWAKRAVGLLVGSGIGLLVLRMVLRRRKAHSLEDNAWVLVRARDLEDADIPIVTVRD